MAYQLGLIVYLSMQGCNGLFGLFLLRKWRCRKFLPFTAYIVVGALHSLILFGLISHREAYITVWGLGRPAMFILKLWIVGGLLHEIFGSRCRDQIPALCALVASPLLFHINIPFERVFGIVLAVSMVGFALAEKRLSRQSIAIVQGLFAVSLLTAIAEFSSSMPPLSWIRFVPTVAYSAALLLWIKAFREPV